ncbi:hypothetical protein PB01_10925 [Psychrobacillus glaciei]|uniref:Uncharacterized protein n=2 Tax=Psychrobacillus glaciei TaxID=2283160 RepID=A0A5J6SSU1_9BACI|nr:hypothetical protein PB01_10925 [Psychrobacillus glaciei]
MELFSFWSVFTIIKNAKEVLFMKKWSTYIWKLIWVIGLFLLTIISFDIKNQIKDSSHFYMIDWTNFIIHFIWGIYISLIFIKKWSIKINLPLLICVSIPCFLFSLIMPLYAFGSWSLKVFSSNLIEIVAGLTWMLSIFNNSNSESE